MEEIGEKKKEKIGRKGKSISDVGFVGLERLMSAWRSKAKSFCIMLLSFLPLAVMDQEQYTSTQVAFKDPTTLETIPEDVAVIIAELVKSWADIDGNLEQKDKAKRSVECQSSSSLRFNTSFLPLLNLSSSG